MKNIISFFIILPFIITNAINAQQAYSVMHIDSSLLKNANAVIRDYQSTFQVITPGTATQKVKMVVTRLNGKADYDNLAIYYRDDYKIKNIAATIYDAYGNIIRKIKKEEIKDLSNNNGVDIYSDVRLKYIDLTYGGYPYTIEYEYEVNIKGIFRYPIWDIQNYYTSVISSSYTIILPPNIDVKSKLYNLNITPATTNVNGLKTTTWKATNILVVSQENYTKEDFKLLASGFFIPSEFEISGYKGSMFTWNDFGKFLYELNKDRDNLSPYMAEEVKKMTKEAKNNREKIAILYRYLQDNMRYVSVQLGIGGWQTYDAQYVEQNKYGDCKALSNFMKAMLKALGIPAYTAVVYGDSNGVPLEAEENFSFPLFNHVILYVPEEEIWLECTSKDHPVNYLGNFTSDRNVLLITEKGGKLIKTPSSSSCDLNQQLSNIHIALTSEGLADIKNSMQLKGEPQDNLRSYYKAKEDKKAKEYLLQLSNVSLDELTAFEYYPNMEIPSLNLNYEAKVNKYATKSGKRLFVPLFAINSFRNVPKTEEGRQNPVIIKNGYTKIDTTIITLPTGAKVESIMDDFKLETAYGTYEVNIQKSENQLTCIRKVVIHAMEVPKEEYNDWRSFYQQIVKKDSAKMVVLLSNS